MAKEVDLMYRSDSFAGQFDQNELEVFEKWLQKCQSSRIQFDPSYVKHISLHHGGVPGKRYFRTRSGTKHVVVRFLNFLPPSAQGPMAAYSVEGTWGLIEDRLDSHLIPFAELFGGDMLCFNYETSGRPQVVVWFHDRSLEGVPYTEVVANSFDEFLENLSDTTL